MIKALLTVTISSANSCKKVRVKQLILGLFVLCFTCSDLHAQHRQLEIISTENPRFFLVLDNKLLTKHSCQKFFLDSIAQTSLQAWVFIDSTFLFNAVELNLAEEGLHSFQLAVVEGKISLLPVGVSPLRQPEPLSKSKKPTAINQAGATESYTLERLFERSAQQRYSGKTGCSSSLNPIRFQAKLEQIQSLLFEQQRLGKVKELITEECLEVAQLKNLLKLFEFDDTRLEIVAFTEGKIYDLGSLNELKSVLTFNSNRIKLDQLIKEFQNKQSR